ncbi:hypothetical protein SAMN06309944_0220 [Micrococcales bacterium KH10]|nr:hypothetical protein SAMN06309944_0220 [Micrococcales bacterium KH10]
MSDYESHLANQVEADYQTRQLQQVEAANTEIEAIVERLKELALDGEALTDGLADLCTALQSWAHATEGLM